MITDVWTVMWKEWKEHLLRRGNLQGGAMLISFSVGSLGIIGPLLMKHDWIDSPMTLIYSVVTPLFMVASVVADAFAGERERHTLETLLASRLSDRAILFGKIGATVGYGWGLTLLILLVGLITVNLTYARGGVLLYPATVALANVGLSLLLNGLAATAGVLVSLRAKTVRQAQQSLTIAIMLLLFGLVFGIRALPAEWTANLAEALLAADVRQMMLLAALLLTASDMGLLAAAMARFQRARLIVD